MSTFDGASLNDLRRMYYGGGSEAEYAFMQEAAEEGVTAFDVIDLIVNGGGGGGGSLPLDTKGDILAHNGSTLVRVPVGTVGQQVYADPTQASGLKWDNPVTGVTDHGLLSGLGDDDHTQYHTDTRGDLRYVLLTAKGAALGVASLDGSATIPTSQVPTLDHGAKLSGLGDDDHTQYHTDGRGDTRYYTKTTMDNATTGFARLSGGVLDPSVLPTLAISEVFTANSQAAQVALTAQRGDMCIRTDQSGQCYVLSTDNAAVFANWVAISSAGAVTSVNSQTGAVTITLSGLGGIATAISDAKGDLIVGSADNTVSRLPVGVTDGQLLMVNSGATLGVEWGVVNADGILTEPHDMFGVIPILGEDVQQELVNIWENQYFHAVSTTEHGLTTSRVPQANASGAYVFKDLGTAPATNPPSGEMWAFVDANVFTLRDSSGHDTVLSPPFVDQYARVTGAALSKTSDTALADLFSAPVEKSAVYHVEGFLFYEAHVSGDLKWTLTCDATVTAIAFGAYAISGGFAGGGGAAASASFNSKQASGDTMSVGGGDAANILCMHWFAVLETGSTTAGSLKFRWAQNASHATPTKIYAPSDFYVKRVL